MVIQFVVNVNNYLKLIYHVNHNPIEIIFYSSNYRKLLLINLQVMLMLNKQ